MRPLLFDIEQRQELRLGIRRLLELPDTSPTSKAILSSAYDELARVDRFLVSDDPQEASGDDEEAALASAVTDLGDRIATPLRRRA